MRDHQQQQKRVVRDHAVDENEEDEIDAAAEAERFDGKGKVNVDHEVDVDDQRYEHYDYEKGNQHKN